jgi:Mce-associated membrane protein
MRRSWGFLLVALALLAGGTTAGAAQPEDVTGPGNRALVDFAATAEIVAAAKEICTRVFAYDYTKPQLTEQAVAELTIGEFREQHAKLYGELQRQGPAQRLVVTVTVRDAAVRRHAGDEARVLVFLDQSSTRGDSGQSATAGSMFLATFQRVDRWKLAGVEFFS